MSDKVIGLDVSAGKITVSMSNLQGNITLSRINIKSVGYSQSDDGLRFLLNCQGENCCQESVNLSKSESLG